MDVSMDGDLSVIRPTLQRLLGRSFLEKVAILAATVDLEGKNLLLALLHLPSALSVAFL
jgi:hypothetical protein